MLLYLHFALYLASQSCESTRPSSDQLVQHLPVCISEHINPPADPAQVSGCAPSAWVPKSFIWQGRKELRVRFLTAVPPHWTYAGGGMSTDIIISWANVWSTMAEGIIPSFVVDEDPSAPVDIRVYFNSTCRALDMCGVHLLIISFGKEEE